MLTLIPDRKTVRLTESCASPDQTLESSTTEQHLSDHSSHLPWVDGLRGAAVLSVLAYHLRLLRGGSLGVDVFFVLSGFLITSLLAKEWETSRTIRFGRFYLRRALRLLPAFLVLLAGCYIYTLAFRPASEANALREEITVVACHLTNWPSLYRTPLPLLGHTWSLCIEDQFYLVWPLLLYALLRSGLSRRSIMAVICLGIVSSMLVRAVLFDHRPPAGPERTVYMMQLYLGLHTRADALLVGCVTGLLASWNLVPKSRRFVRAIRVAAIMSALGFVGLLGSSCFGHLFFYGLFTLVALMTAMIVVAFLTAPARVPLRVLQSAPLVFIGRISYGLYLFHIPIIEWIGPSRVGRESPAATALTLVLCVGVAAGSYYGIERPCLRLKNRFASRPNSAPLPILPSINSTSTAKVETADTSYPVAIRIANPPIGHSKREFCG